MEIKEILNQTQAAKYLDVSRATVARLQKKGIIQSLSNEKKEYCKKELEEYINREVKEGNYKIELDGTPRVIKMVDSRNSLNDLNGTEWLPETKSFWFQKGLGSKHPHAQIEKQHPAPFSYQDIQRLIEFFTKKGEKVLDPFSGVGSTVKACELSGRIGIGIELSEKWNELAKRRIEVECDKKDFSHKFIQGDCRKVLLEIEEKVDFIVTSPPYWSILNKKADHKVKNERLANDLATNYSDSNEDLGNVENYDNFLKILVNDVFLKCGLILNDNKYMAIVVSDFRDKSKFISFHSDLIQHLQDKEIDDKFAFTLVGVKALLQNHKSLLPYGYPFAYVENIHHQYILIFKKTKRSKVKNDGN